MTFWFAFIFLVGVIATLAAIAFASVKVWELFESVGDLRKENKRLNGHMDRLFDRHHETRREYADLLSRYKSESLTVINEKAQETQRLFGNRLAVLETGMKKVHGDLVLELKSMCAARFEANEKAISYIAGNLDQTITYVNKLVDLAQASGELETASEPKAETPKAETPADTVQAPAQNTPPSAS